MNKDNFEYSFIDMCHKLTLGENVSEASDWLVKCVESEFCWTTCHHILHNSHGAYSFNEPFFAAKVIQTLVENRWSYLAPNMKDDIRKSLIDDIFTLNGQTTNITMKQLCTALATALIYACISDGEASLPNFTRIEPEQSVIFYSIFDEIPTLFYRLQKLNKVASSDVNVIKTLKKCIFSHLVTIPQLLHTSFAPAIIQSALQCLHIWIEFTDPCLSMRSASRVLYEDNAWVTLQDMISSYTDGTDPSVWYTSTLLSILTHQLLPFLLVSCRESPSDILHTSLLSCIDVLTSLITVKSPSNMLLTSLSHNMTQYTVSLQDTIIPSSLAILHVWSVLPEIYQQMGINIRAIASTTTVHQQLADLQKSYYNNAIYSEGLSVAIASLLAILIEYHALLFYPPQNNLLAYPQTLFQSTFDATPSICYHFGAVVLTTLAVVDAGNCLLIVDALSQLSDEDVNLETKITNAFWLVQSEGSPIVTLVHILQEKSMIPIYRLHDYQMYPNRKLLTFCAETSDEGNAHITVRREISQLLIRIWKRWPDGRLIVSLLLEVMTSSLRELGSLVSSYDNSNVLQVQYRLQLVQRVECYFASFATLIEYILSENSARYNLQDQVRCNIGITDLVFKLHEYSACPREVLVLTCDMWNSVANVVAQDVEDNDEDYSTFTVTVDFDSNVRQLTYDDVIGIMVAVAKHVMPHSLTHTLNLFMSLRPTFSSGIRCSIMTDIITALKDYACSGEVSHKYFLVLGSYLTSLSEFASTSSLVMEYIESILNHICNPITIVIEEYNSRDIETEGTVSSIVAQLEHLKGFVKSIAECRYFSIYIPQIRVILMNVIAIVDSSGEEVNALVLCFDILNSTYDSNIDLAPVEYYNLITSLSFVDAHVTFSEYNLLCLEKVISLVTILIRRSCTHVELHVPLGEIISRCLVNLTVLLTPSEVNEDASYIDVLTLTFKMYRQMITSMISLFWLHGGNVEQPCIVYILRLLRAVISASSIRTPDGYLSRTNMNILVNVFHQLYAHKQCNNVNLYQQEFHATLSSLYCSVFFTNQYMLLSSSMLFDTMFFLVQLLVKNMTFFNNTSQSFELNECYQKVCCLVVQEKSQHFTLSVLVDAITEQEISIEDFLNAAFNRILSVHESRRDFNNALSDICQLTRLQKSCRDINFFA